MTNAIRNKGRPASTPPAGKAQRNYRGGGECAGRGKSFLQRECHAIHVDSSARRLCNHDSAGREVLLHLARNHDVRVRYGTGQKPLRENGDDRQTPRHGPDWISASQPIRVCDEVGSPLRSREVVRCDFPQRREARVLGDALLDVLQRRERKAHLRGEILGVSRVGS